MCPYYRTVKSIYFSQTVKTKNCIRGIKNMKKLCNVLTAVKVAMMVIYLKEYRENELAEIEGV